MQQEFETLGYLQPEKVHAICLSCRARQIVTEGYGTDVLIHIKENYIPLEDIECDICGDLILPRKGLTNKKTK